MAKPKTKPQKQRLKLFRTPIGFHDAYVAAPSRKAALEAWGSGTDLFSAGIAEELKDAKLLRELQERPGEVVRKPRGSAKEHAAGLERIGRTETKQEGGPRIKSGKTKGKKPSRGALDKADAAVAKLEKRQAEERGELDREERALAKRGERQEEKDAKAMEKATATRDKAKEKYRVAMAKWGR